MLEHHQHDDVQGFGKELCNASGTHIDLKVPTSPKRSYDDTGDFDRDEVLHIKGGHIWLRRVGMILEKARSDRAVFERKRSICSF
jgi:hypothetical protein